MILLPEDHLDSEQMTALHGWMIDKEHLQPGKCLGQGQFGKVFLGSLTMKGGGTKEVAFKTMKSKCQSDSSVIIFATLCCSIISRIPFSFF